jgi:flagellar hook-associated protein 1 FlgK
VDGGKTWLKDSAGSELHYYARTKDTATDVGSLSIWFGTATSSDTAPGTSLSVGDKFTITPMKALYWNANTSTKENITPFVDASGQQDTRRLTGGTLSALCSYKNDYLGSYKEKLDAVAKTLVWETNRLHSQGAGLATRTEITGTYSVKHDNMALGSNSAGLVFGNRPA